MYNPELTIETACAKLANGTQEAWFQQELDENSQFVQALKHYRKVLFEFLASNLAIDLRIKDRTEASIIFTMNCSEKNRKTLRNAIINRDKTYNQTKIPSFLCSAVTYGRIEVMSKEMLWNAIEHGTNWCTSSPVKLRAVKNSLGAFAIIDQGKGGITREQLSDLQKTELLRVNCGVELRGCGLKYAIDCKTTQVNFPNDGSQTLIFSPTKRFES